MTGHVEWYEPKKGYGFIRSQENSSLIYFHHSEFIDIEHAKTGEALKFDLTPGEKGPKAIHISR